MIYSSYKTLTKNNKLSLQSPFKNNPTDSPNYLNPPNNKKIYHNFKPTKSLRSLIQNLPIKNTLFNFNQVLRIKYQDKQKPK